MKHKLTIILALAAVLLTALLAVGFSPEFSQSATAIICRFEATPCVSIWNGNDIVAFRDQGGTETIRVDGDGAMRIAVPTQVGTATPGLVIQMGANGNALEIRNAGGTPVSSISGAGALSGFGSTGLSVAPNIVVAAPTGVGTATPVALINSAGGVSNLLEVRNASTPQLVAYAGGGVRVAAPTAVATGVPVMIIQGQGASNQLEIRNAGATPVASFGPDGSPAFIAASIDSTEIANQSRSVTLGLMTWIDCTTDAGAALNFSSGADAFPDFINSATDGLGFTLTFDDTGASEDTVRICASITVPPDYASGGALIARVTKDAESAATEVLNCAGSINGAALGAAGTVTLTGTASAAYTCTPTLTSLAAGDSVALTAYITSATTMDDTINVHAVQFQYTAVQ